MSLCNNINACSDALSTNLKYSNDIGHPCDQLCCILNCVINGMLFKSLFEQ